MPSGKPLVYAGQKNSRQLTLISDSTITIDNRHYDPNDTSWIYVDLDSDVLPCIPENPFQNYSDAFSICKHDDGRIRLVGNQYTAYKGPRTDWEWCCTKTTSTKTFRLQEAKNSGYVDLQKNVLVFSPETGLKL